MEENGVFIFGQTQEQIDTNYNMTSEDNKDFYSVLRNKIYKLTQKRNGQLDLYITMERGLGFTSLITGLSVNNAHEGFTAPVKINAILPNHKFTSRWRFSDTQEYDRLILFADSVRAASQANEFTDADWIKAGKTMIDNSSLGIIAIPDVKPEYLKEVIRYGLGRNVPMLKINSKLEFSEITLVDVMM